MKRLFTLMLVLTAFVFAFTSPLAMHNAVAADEGAATAATDDAMKGDNGDNGKTGKKTHHHKGKKAHKAKHHKKHIGPHHAKTTEEGKTVGSHPQPSDNGNQ